MRWSRRGGRPHSGRQADTVGTAGPREGPFADTERAITIGERRGAGRRADPLPPLLTPTGERTTHPPGTRHPDRAHVRHIVQLVDQLDRLQLEREVSTPELSNELQLDRLQLERAKSSPSPPGALLHEDRLQDDRA